MAKYVAYIDESGDPSVKAIKPGGSAWFILSCVLAQESNVPALGNTHARILSQFRNCQTSHLHFHKLIHAKKVISCSEIAKTPCRAFVTISNKKNLLGYRNPNLPPNKDWLYWWMTRLLLERVTDYCFRHANKNGITEPTIRIVLSRRGGNDYDEFKKYLATLSFQSKVGGLYIDTGDLAWPVYDPNEIHIIDAKENVGLQLADTISGAFFNGLETSTSQHDTRYVNILKPVLATSANNRQFGYGIKTMPALDKISLCPKQKSVFTTCDYKGRWAPGS